jgi:type IV pilus assembly protein PilX
MSLRSRSGRRAQRGVTMLVVLVLMSVMLLGALAMARMTEVGALAAGNTAYREASLQASEVGLNTVYAQVRAIAATAENDNAAGWYWSTAQAQDANGLPDVNWNAAPEIAVGNYSVRYVSERLCTVATITDPLRDCLVKQIPVPTSARGGTGNDKLDPPNSRQYRVTIRVTGPKGTTTFIQSLLTKG